MPSVNYRNYIKHLKSIIQFFEQAPKTSEGWLYDQIAHGILARSETAILRICPEGSPYRARMAKALESSSQERVQADRVVGIVRALKGDLEDGYLHSLSELVRGEMFENLIEMATHLLNEGYKDAAAVITGSSLESHLRQLCIEHGVQINHTAPDGTIKPKKADQLNQALRKKGAYSLF